VKTKTKDCVSHFSKLWLTRRKLFQSSGFEETGRDISNTVLAAHDRILRFDTTLTKNDEVGVINLPFERSFKDFIVTDCIDSIVVTKDPKTKVSSVRLIVLDNSLASPGENDFHSCLRAMISVAYAKRELTSVNEHIVSEVYNPYTNSRRVLNLTKALRVNYPSVIRNIVDSMNRKTYYPVANSNNCKSCVYNKECMWSMK
jgi:hypothetical protein